MKYQGNSVCLCHIWSESFKWSSSPIYAFTWGKTRIGHSLVLEPILQHPDHISRVHRSIKLLSRDIGYSHFGPSICYMLTKLTLGTITLLYMDTGTNRCFFSPSGALVLERAILPEKNVCAKCPCRTLY